MSDGWEIVQLVDQSDDDDSAPVVSYERVFCPCPDPETGHAWVEGYKQMFWKGHCPDWIYYEVRPV